jgi:hypothetical protein
VKNPFTDLNLNVGVVLAIAGCVLCVITFGIAWTSWSRWAGIAAINAANVRLLQGNDATIKSRTNKAARELPDHAAAILLDTDLMNEGDCLRLEALERKISSADAVLVQTAEALSAALRGKQPAQRIGGSDGTLIAAIADLAKGGRPHPLVLDKDAPPHHTVMAHAYVKQLHAALAVGDRDLIKDAACTLALLLPAHPDGGALRFITAILDPGAPIPKVNQAAAQVQEAQRKRVANLMAGIVPERASVLTAIGLGVPSETPAAQLLSAQVAAAISQDGDVDRVGLVRRCLDAGRYDLAKQLLPKMPQARQAELKNIIMNQEGNLPELTKAGASDPGLRPRVSQLCTRTGFVGFHISNDVGMVPKTAISVAFNGNNIPRSAICQNGSMFSVQIETGMSGLGTLEIRAGTEVLMTKQVTL